MPRPTARLPALLPLIALLLISCGERAPSRSAEYERALALLQSGRPAEAWPVIEAEAARAPDDAATLVLLVRIARPLARFPKASAALRRALELAPRDPDVLLEAAAFEQDMALLGDAVAHARAATEVAPDRADAHARLGELLLATARPEEAAESFARAVELDPDDLLLVGTLGRALVLAGRHEEGLPYLDRYLAERPADPEAHVQRGIARLRARDLESAEGDFRAAIRLDPSLPTPYHNLAIVLQRTGRVDEAAQVRERHRAVNELDWKIRGVRRRLGSEPLNPEWNRELLELLREAGRTAEADELQRRLRR
jgi:tetratricopeptide (TPR) repeat protein